MKIQAKMGVVFSTLTVAALLSACQSTAPAQEKRMHAGKHKSMQMHGRHHQQHMRGQIQQACQGKTAGEKIAVQVGERNIQGSCQLSFVPERQAKAAKRSVRGQYNTPKLAVHPYKGQYGVALTDAQRAELVKQYDLRLAQRQAQQNAIQQACQGKKADTKVSLKLAEQSLTGQCQLKFQPDATTSPKKVAAA